MLEHVNHIITSVSGTDFAIVSTVTAVLYKGGRWAWLKFRQPKEFEEYKCWHRDYDNEVRKAKVRFFVSGQITVLVGERWQLANADGTFPDRYGCVGGSRWWTSKPPLAKGAA